MWRLENVICPARFPGSLLSVTPLSATPAFCAHTFWSKREVRMWVSRSAWGRGEAPRGARRPRVRHAHTYSARAARVVPLATARVLTVNMGRSRRIWSVAAFRPSLSSHKGARSGSAAQALAVNPPEADSLLQKKEGPHAVRSRGLFSVIGWWLPGQDSNPARGGINSRRKGLVFTPRNSARRPDL